MTSSSPHHSPTVSTLSWIAGAWRIIKQNPQVWLLAGGIMMVALFASISLQWFGQVILSLLTPVFIGALMLGCADTDVGKPITLSHLISTFVDHEKLKRLMLLGCILLVFYIALVAVSLGLFLLMGGGTVIEELQLYLSQELPEERAKALIEQLMPMLILGFIVLCLYFLASFFSIPHVVFRNADPFRAIVISLVYSVKHLITVFGVCFVIFSVSVIASLLLYKTQLAIVFMLVVVWPFTICVQYVAYVSVFGGPNSSDSNTNRDSNDTTLTA